jgi:cyclopropane fatty-acyl-phospholipid synthase-like methyltransferase
MSSYDHYVRDEAFLAYYNDYQKRYAGQIAERDKVVLGLIAERLEGQGSLLDIGCSTGNLLLHISRAFPSLRLTGGELAESSLVEASKTPELSAVEFRAMDMLAIPGSYDCIIANAVAVYFGWDEYEQALHSVAGALNPGGIYIAFEWLHPYEDQDLEIHETTVSHPDGLKIHFRPYGKVARVLTKAGLGDVEFRSFTMPMDLPFPGYEGDAVSYTVPKADGERLCFRGTLFQPWCHLIARKP